MTIDASPIASDFDRGSHHYVDLGLVLAFGLKNTPPSAVQGICDRATESFAREVLHWPNGRLIKPDIFKVDEVSENLHDLDACTELFINRLRSLFESPPPYEIPIYPHAFIVVDEEDVQYPEHVTLAMAHQVDERWKIDYCVVPTHVELGMVVDSFRLGDGEKQDVLDKYPIFQ
ncbi:hypothetical protein CC79DRAFT_1048893 [Sarocladium strictum]